MKMLSMMDFKKMCESIAPASFVFNTENQPNGMSEKAKFVQRYTDVIFMLAPDRICFKNDIETLCFSGIKSIRYNDDEKHVGEIFNITCGILDDNSADISYTIIADCTK